MDLMELNEVIPNMDKLWPGRTILLLKKFPEDKQLHVVAGKGEAYV